MRGNHSVKKETATTRSESTGENDENSSHHSSVAWANS